MEDKSQVNTLYSDPFGKFWSALCPVICFRNVKSLNFKEAPKKAPSEPKEFRFKTTKNLYLVKVIHTRIHVPRNPKTLFFYNFWIAGTHFC
jgi:hypothetical protein